MERERENVFQGNNVDDATSSVCQYLYRQILTAALYGPHCAVNNVCKLERLIVRESAGGL